MKFKKVVHLYLEQLENYTLKIMKKYLEIYQKKLEKSWKYHGILSVRKSGNPALGIKVNLYHPTCQVSFLHGNLVKSRYITESAHYRCQH